MGGCDLKEVYMKIKTLCVALLATVKVAYSGVSSGNIVGYHNHSDSSGIITIQASDVNNTGQGVSVSNIEVNGDVPGSQLCYFDGNKWIHLEHLLCDGELHWCKWLNDKTAIVADDFIIPCGTKLSYALIEGVTSICISGEYQNPDEEQILLSDFVIDEKTISYIKEALEELVKERAVVTRTIIINDEENNFRTEPITNICDNVEVGATVTNVVTCTNYITKIQTNYVSVMKSKLKVRLQSGKYVPAVFVVEFCRVCNPQTGIPLDIDIEKVTFHEDLSVDESLRADAILCQRFYEFQLWYQRGVKVSSEDSKVINKIEDWSWNKIFDLLWKFLILIGIFIISTLQKWKWWKRVVGVWKNLRSMIRNLVS